MDIRGIPQISIGSYIDLVVRHDFVNLSPATSGFSAEPVLLSRQVVDHFAGADQQAQLNLLDLIPNAFRHYREGSPFHAFEFTAVLVRDDGMPAWRKLFACTLVDSENAAFWVITLKS